MHAQDLKQLRQWFLDNRRDLPWRENPSPYAVWVSEVMLQQTQVAVVIPYFLRWMQRFPTIDALAKAPVDHVLKEWEGLGYYSRARNLHQAAQYVVETYGGVLPDSVDGLMKIKGLGEYTVGAILSFAFHKSAAAVDGNVMRVLARYYGIEEDICQGKTRKKIRDLAEHLLPEEEPWTISEGLIELGATVCMRKAKCLECPLKGHCRAFAEGKQDILPIKGAQTATTALYRLVPVVACKDGFLVSRGTKGKLMADLLQFPYFEVPHAGYTMDEQKRILSAKLQHDLNLKASWKQDLPRVKHSFTRYRACLMPHLFTVKAAARVAGYEWLPLDELQALPFSSGHRRIFSHISAVNISLQ